jgi:hypothetical protein
MTVLAKHLALLACMLGTSGSARGFCATPDAAPRLLPILCTLSHQEFVHSPVNLPARPRPFVVCLREAGIDEEDNDEPGTPAAFAGSSRVGTRSRLSDLQASSAPNGVLRGRSLSRSVLRC